jgi:hypothetical protein
MYGFPIRREGSRRRRPCRDDIEGQVRVGELVILVLVRARGGLSGVVSGRGQVAVAGLRLHDVGQFPPLARAWTRLCCLTEFHHFDIQSTGRAHIGLRAGLLTTDTRLIEFHHFNIQSTGQKSHLPLSHSSSGGSRGKGVGKQSQPFGWQAIGRAGSLNLKWLRRSARLPESTA